MSPNHPKPASNLHIADYKVRLDGGSKRIYNVTGFTVRRLGKTGAPFGADHRARARATTTGELNVRLITGTRARLALAALFVTSFVGLANAQDPTSARFEVLGTRSVDRGPAALPEKTGANPVLQRMPSTPKAMTSNQYPPEVEPNDTSATATPITGTSAAREGNIFPAGDIDFWSFSGTAGDRVYAATMTSLSSNASVDSVLDLIGTDGTTVIETDADDGSFGATSSTIAGATLPTTGTYFLRVRHAAAATQLRPYRLFLQLRSGAPTAETEPNDTFPGQAMPAGNWVSGATSSTTDPDFYSLNLNAGDTVFVSVDLDRNVTPSSGTRRSVSVRSAHRHSSSSSMTLAQRRRTPKRSS